MSMPPTAKSGKSRASSWTPAAVTHVMLQEGHVFGRSVVTIPVGAVTAPNENDIQLNITKQQVKDLPSRWYRSPGE